MTTPIPESAVEPALRAWFEHERTAHPMNTLGDRMRAALTAARPHMEAEAKAEAWDDAWDAADDFYNGPDWATAPINPYRAATIAERTNDEPVGR